MKRFAWALALLLAHGDFACGQIEVAPSTEPYKILTASVKSEVPEGATIDGGWSVSEGVSFVLKDRDTIWWTAAPGEHTFTYDGIWVHTVPVTFKDGDGNSVTIQSYLGAGRVTHQAKSTVVGGADPVDPKPQPPQPGGPKAVVFFIEADELDKMPRAQKYLVNSLAARRNLEARGHKYLRVIDDNVLKLASPPPQWAPWIEAVRGDPLPRVALAPIEGGPVEDFDLPADWNRLLDLLGEPR